MSGVVGGERFESVENREEGRGGGGLDWLFFDFVCLSVCRYLCLMYSQSILQLRSFWHCISESVGIIK